MLALSSGVTLALSVILTVIHAIAISLTFFRVYYRANTGRLWWDDYVAFFAALFDCAYISVLWFNYVGHGSMLQTHWGMVVRYWLGLMLFLVVIWMVRISLALAIARIYPPMDPTRIFATGMAILSTILCLVCIIQTSVLCSNQPALVSGPNAACVWNTRVRFFIVIANILSDSLLIATPLYKLWGVRLPRKQRRLILGAFAAGSVTTPATLVCAFFQFAPDNWEPAKGTAQVILGYFETGISLVVCNLLVVLTYLHTVTHREEDLEVSESESSCEPREEGAQSSSVQPYTLTEITDAYRTTDSARYEAEAHGAPQLSTTTPSTPNFLSTHAPSSNTRTVADTHSSL